MLPRSSALLLSVLLPLVAPSLDRASLRQLCHGEKELCYKKAEGGECFGSSLKAKVLQKQCACSCDAVHHERIQSCCKRVGEAEMKFCLPLCGYNSTVDSLHGSLGIKCVSQLTTWAYCAADNNDCTPCCAARGVPPECRSFCQGRVPTCDTESIFQYQGCLQHMGQIIACQKEALGPLPRFDPDWSSSCDWEGK